ncbi:MAG TPA: hypothetical protein DDZ41_07855, partial [Flavobacterium sp.]|nr:hypothetical protein [Flavobacterium sp.]
MNKCAKIIVALFVVFLLFSFSSATKVHLKTSNNLILEDTLTWKLLGEIKYNKKTLKDYGEVEFPVVNA